jgi:Rha family phage regulatory protein
MNQLVFVENNHIVTDSLTVAEVFGKEHRNVLADIDGQIEKLNAAGEEEFSLLNFQQSTYTNERGRQYRKYLLTEEGFTLVTMAYTTVEAMKFKVRFINEFNRMKQQLATPMPSYMIEDKITRAERWIEEEKQRRNLETQNLMLEQRVAEYEPKVTYLDQILKSKDTVTITQIAKDYGLSGRQLNKILHEEKVQFKQNGQWLLYKKHQDCGYTKSQTIDVIHNDGSRSVKMNTRWTQKGRLFIHEILTKRGIIANMDRDSA